MARRISVRLDLEAKGAITDATALAGAMKSTDAETKSLGRQLDSTSKDMVEFGVTAAVAKREVDKLGDEAQQTALQMEGLDKRIKAAKTSVGQLQLEFAKTGDIGLKKDIAAAEKALRELEKTRRSVIAFAATDVTAKAGILASAGIADAAGKTFLQSLEGLKGKAVPILIGTVAALLPAIGAMVSGAVIGAVGTGGLVGGIASALKDPRTKFAFGNFAAGISEEFFSGGSMFVGPIEQSLGILERDFKALDLGDAFAKVAPFVPRLAEGIGDFAKNIMPGFNEVMDLSGPAINITAEGLADLGDAFSDLFSELANSPGTLEGLRDLFGLLGATIRGTGHALDLLTDTYHLLKVTHVTDAVGALVDEVGFAVDLLDKAVEGWTFILSHPLGQQERFAGRNTDLQLTHDVEHHDEFGRQIDQVTTSMHNQYAAARDLRSALADLGKAYQDATQNAHDLWLSNIDVAQGMADVKQALADGKTGWDLNTQAGRDNQTMIANQLQRLQDQRDAEIRASDGTTASIDKIKTKYNEQVIALEALAGKLGATKKQLEEISKTWLITVGIQYGVGDPERALDQAFQHMPRHASGGYESGMRPYWAGEKGPELILPNGHGQKILTHQQSIAAWNGAGMASVGSDSSLTIIVKDTAGRTQRKEKIRYDQNRGLPSSTIRANNP